MAEPPLPPAPGGRDTVGDPVVTVALDIAVAGQKMHFEIRMDAAPASAAALIPIARALHEAISGRVVEVLASGGHEVSCRKGCAACCRHAVPISIAEARALHALVAAMPEPRRGAVRRRFAVARETLTAAGLLDQFCGRAPVPDGTLLELDRRYRGLRLACPFLEDEACTIHAERPLVCREFMVTSPPAACFDLDSGEVRGVPSSAAVSTAMMVADPETTAVGSHWIAIATALDWVDANPAPAAPVDGQELLRQFLSQLFKRELPAPGASMLDAAR